MRWVAGILAVLTIEVVIGMGIVIIGLEENCNNGIARWQCDEGTQDALVALFFVVPVLALGLALWQRSDRAR
jgi:heme A synthase